MRTSEQYLEDLRSMKQNVYMGGEIAKRDDPLIIPGINVMRITFDMADDPDKSELFTATSPYTGEKINRFCHVE
jgi:4-hydroxybutyryl-CoA dehydratase/vinylacetyl-CoA-Delta-isomerase